MARKSVVVLTSVVGLAAVAAGAYVARHRRDAQPSTGTAQAKPLTKDWRAADALTEELANVMDSESVAAH
ncbi:MAG TPA: hypothetical protein VGJ28_04640 [Micromonosporaceae bacterium]|jgi:hypothetical protein